MVTSRGGPPAGVGKHGLFSEMGYTTVGEPYTSPNARAYNDAASRGKQMLTTATKSRSGRGDGYFTHEFKRVFEKEAYSDPVRTRRRERIEKKKKNVVPKPFLPSNSTKLPSGIGGYHGTFGFNGQGPYKYFSSVKRDRAAHTSPPKNFVCNPAKKGSGYGYVDVTIGEYAKSMSEKADRAADLADKERAEARRRMVGGPFLLNMHPKPIFESNPYKTDKQFPPAKVQKEKPPLLTSPFKPTSPAKKPGNCKDGTFTKYPVHPVDGYGVKGKKPAGPKYGMFVPPTVPKSRPTDSLVRRSVARKLNTTNYLSIQTAF